jgi:hypothetical protein
MTEFSVGTYAKPWKESILDGWQDGSAFLCGRVAMHKTGWVVCTYAH